MNEGRRIALFFANQVGYDVPFLDPERSQTAMSVSGWWACAMTHPQREAEAVVNLRQQNIRAFYPFYFTQSKTLPIFPRYIFVLVDDYCWPVVWNTRGVASLLTGATGSDSRRPAPLPQHYIDGMRIYLHLLTEGGRRLSQIPEKGSHVVVSAGPFQGQHGIVLRIIKKESRLHVLLTVFGRQTEVDLPIDGVKLAAL